MALGVGLGGAACAVADSRRRALVTALVVTAAIVAGVAAADHGAIAQSPSPTWFDIPAGPLNRALATFGRQAGLQVTYLAVVCAGKTSPGASGPATPEDALARILRGTGLTYSFPNATTVAISEPSADAGDVVDDGSLLLDTIGVAAVQAALAARAARASADARAASPHGYR